MTMPHLMNCPHQEEGWCLDCVGKLYSGYSPDEMREMLLAWQDWWNGYGSEWYIYSEHPQCEKPPFLIYGNEMYGKWVCDGKG